MRPLVAVEILSVASFFAISAYATFAGPPALPALDPEALPKGETDERWTGIFLQDHHVGYAVARSARRPDGGTVFEEQSTFRLNEMGNEAQIVIAGTASLGPDRALERFDFAVNEPLAVSVHGEMHGLTLHLDVRQGDSTQQQDIALDAPPVLPATLSEVLKERELRVGDTFQVPYFDPFTRANSIATFRVETNEVLPNGESGWWVSYDVSGIPTRALVDEHGQTIREEGANGMRSQVMTREAAMAIDAGPLPDLVATNAAPLTGTIDESHPNYIVTLQISGVEASRFASDPPLQTVDGDRVTVTVPLLAELPSLPIRGDTDVSPTLTLPSTNPEMVARAQAVIGDAPDRLEATRRLYAFVHEYVQKVPVIGIPNGLTVLHEGRGDCNEHTALFVSLARAVGIPSRIAAGLVYSSRSGDEPAFFYHAWPEVRLGVDGAWVPIDPTLEQFPADATHLKVVNGDLDQQAPIMGMVGRVKLTLVEAR